MKHHKIKLLTYHRDKIFSPVRRQLDFVKLILNSSKILLTPLPDIRGKESNCYLELRISKMSRLFFFDKDKHFSVHYPFNVEKNNEMVISCPILNITLDSKIISETISISKEFEKNNSSLINTYLSIDSEEWKVNPLDDAFSLFEWLLTTEASYIRYDYDKKNEKGEFHPLHHLDINFSQRGAYKIGLEQSMPAPHFVDMLDITKECFFIRLNE